MRPIKNAAEHFVSYKETRFGMAFKFQELRIWHTAIEFSTEIFTLSKAFPEEEKWNLISQIRRAADSIALNISEGSTGQSHAEFSRFLGMAQRSCIEVVTCIVLAQRRNYILQHTADSFIGKAESLVKSIQSMRSYLNSQQKKKGI